MVETLLTVGEQEVVELNSHLKRENLDLKLIFAQLQQAERAQGLRSRDSFPSPLCPGFTITFNFFTVCPFAAPALCGSICVRMGWSEGGWAHLRRNVIRVWR